MSSIPMEFQPVPSELFLEGRKLQEEQEKYYKNVEELSKEVQTLDESDIAKKCREVFDREKIPAIKEAFQAELPELEKKHSKLAILEVFYDCFFNGGVYDMCDILEKYTEFRVFLRSKSEINFPYFIGVFRSKDIVAVEEMVAQLEKFPELLYVEFDNETLVKILGLSTFSRPLYDYLWRRLDGQLFQIKDDPKYKFDLARTITPGEHGEDQNLFLDKICPYLTDLFGKSPVDLLEPSNGVRCARKPVVVFDESEQIKDVTWEETGVPLIADLVRYVKNCTNADQGWPNVTERIYSTLNVDLSVPVGSEPKVPFYLRYLAMTRDSYLCDEVAMMFETFGSSLDLHKRDDASKLNALEVVLMTADGETILEKLDTLSPNWFSDYESNSGRSILDAMSFNYHTPVPLLERFMTVYGSNPEELKNRLTRSLRALARCVYKSKEKVEETLGKLAELGMSDKCDEFINHIAELSAADLNSAIETFTYVLETYGASVLMPTKFNMACADRRTIVSLGQKMKKIFGEMAPEARKANPGMNPFYIIEQSLGHQSLDFVADADELRTYVSVSSSATGIHLVKNPEVLDRMQKSMVQGIKDFASQELVTLVQKVYVIVLSSKGKTLFGRLGGQIFKECLREHFSLRRPQAEEKEEEE